MLFAVDAQRRFGRVPWVALDQRDAPCDVGSAHVSENAAEAAAERKTASWPAPVTESVFDGAPAAGSALSPPLAAMLQSWELAVDSEVLPLR